MSAAYPAPGAAATNAIRPASAATAETLVLVALVLQMFGAAFVLIGGAALIGVSLFAPFAWSWALAALVLAIGGGAVVFLYRAYEMSDVRLRRGGYVGAEAPTLVIGIVSLLFGILPGILYLIGYAKIGDAIRESRPAPMGYPGYYAPTAAPYAPPIAPPPPVTASTVLACRACGRTYYAGPAAFCPACGQRLAP